MTASNVLNSQQSSATDRVVAQSVCTLVAGQARSLRPTRMMALRLVRGSAWVTLDDGPHGLGGDAAGDVFLQAGQTLWVAAGQHAVVEPVGTAGLQYRWSGLAGGGAHGLLRLRQWWQGRHSTAAQDGAYCA